MSEVGEQGEWQPLRPLIRPIRTLRHWNSFSDQYSAGYDGAVFVFRSFACRGLSSCVDGAAMVE
jgi:hypothetical protein